MPFNLFAKRRHILQLQRFCIAFLLFAFYFFIMIRMLFYFMCFLLFHFPFVSFKTRDFISVLDTISNHLFLVFLTSYFGFGFIGLFLLISHVFPKLADYFSLFRSLDFPCLLCYLLSLLLIKKEETGHWMFGLMIFNIFNRIHLFYCFLFCVCPFFQFHLLQFFVALEVSYILTI